MQISLQTDYALRILMALAATDRQLTIDEIARRYGISRNHLAKVTQGLQAQGYVDTFRGRAGGMRLAVPADRIGIGELVRKFETLDTFVGCFPGGQGCTVDGVCALKPALAGALEAFLAHLDKFTLADLVARPAAFASRLELTA